MHDIITFGGATRDIFFRTSDGKIISDPKDSEDKMLAFKYGQKIISDEAHFLYGGGSFNAAINFTKLGLKVAPCINVGEDETSRSIITTLKSLNIDTSFVNVDLNNHTGISILVIDKGEHIAILHRGANDFLEVKDWDEMNGVKWFYVSSLTGASDSLLPAIFDFASKNGIKVAFNPGCVQLEKGYAGLKGLLGDTEILILNKEEAEELHCSENACKVMDEKALVWSLLKMGPKSVVVTDGRKGNYFGDKDHVYFEEAFHGVKTVDTTGAGDAFGSTFVASIVKGIGRKESLRIASVNAASVVSKLGAQTGLLNMTEIKEILAKSRKAIIN